MGRGRISFVTLRSLIMITLNEKLASSMRQGLAVGGRVMMLTCCLWLQTKCAVSDSQSCKLRPFRHNLIPVQF
jgi:hypothetical protein